MYYGTYTQPEGTSLSSQQVYPFVPGNPAGPSTWFMDLSMTPQTLASGELYQRLSPIDFPALGIMNIDQLAPAVGVTDADVTTYYSVVYW